MSAEMRQRASRLRVDAGRFDGMPSTMPDDMRAGADALDFLVFLDSDDAREGLRREFESRIRTAVTYGIGRGKYEDLSSQQKADWIQHEITTAMASLSVTGLFSREVRDDS